MAQQSLIEMCCLWNWQLGEICTAVVAVWPGPIKHESCTPHATIPDCCSCCCCCCAMQSCCWCCNSLINKPPARGPNLCNCNQVLTSLSLYLSLSEHNLKKQTHVRRQLPLKESKRGGKLLHEMVVVVVVNRLVTCNQLKMTVKMKHWRLARTTEDADTQVASCSCSCNTSHLVGKASGQPGRPAERPSLTLGEKGVGQSGFFLLRSCSYPQCHSECECECEYECEWVPN